MGELAKYAIFGGKKIKSEGVVLQAVRTDSVQQSVFRSCQSYDALVSDSSDIRFLGIAKKISQGSKLNASELEFLLSKAPFPLLMKLVELKRSEKTKIHILSGETSAQAPSREVITPVPLVLIPLGRWIREYVSQRQGGSLVVVSPQNLPSNQSELVRTVGERIATSLRAVPYPKIRVVLDEIDWREFLLGGYVEILASVRASRQGLVLHAPPVEDILSWICETRQITDLPSAGHQNILMEDLERVLMKLKAHGFDGLRASCSTQVLKLVRDVGFTNSLVTNIDLFRTHTELAHELCTIEKFAEEGSLLEVWVPGFSYPQQASQNKDTERNFHVKGVQTSSIRDYQVLRLLAVGALYLDRVPLKRASSRYLSLQGLQFALACGANEFGFGALDESTAQSLRLHHYEELAGVLPGAVGGH